VPSDRYSDLRQQHLDFYVLYLVYLIVDADVYDYLYLQRAEQLARLSCDAR
jgi:hypothetical protein